MNPVFFFLFIIYSSHLCSVHAQLYESFSDGNHHSNPAWKGDSSHFIVNDSFQLQLQAPAQQTISYLSTSSKISMEAEWSFSVKTNFNPSSANYVKIYLMSSSAHLKGSLSGYYVRIGHTDDDICLFRQDGLTETKLIDGKNKRTDMPQVNINIKVLRDKSFAWQLFSDTTGNETWYAEGNCVDSNYKQSSYFGLVCIYSATRSNAFFFDNIYIAAKPFVDSIAPTIVHVRTISDTLLQVCFSEPIDSSAAMRLNGYSVSDCHPTKVEMINTSCIHLTFSKPFTKGYNNLTCVHIADTSNNCSDTLTTSFLYYHPQTNDIVFNEIMADPIPSVLLPEAEYIELYNRCPFPISLNKYTLTIGNTTKIFPDITIPSGGYVLICHPAYKDSFPGTLVCPLFSSSTSLANDGQTLMLSDSCGKRISYMKYHKQLYKNTVKAEGGWSLEQIDPDNPCNIETNWTASISPTGGTPGYRNATHADNKDLLPPYVLRTGVENDSVLMVFFSESMDGSSLCDKNNYAVNEQIGNPIYCLPREEDNTSVKLFFAKKFLPNKKYVLSVRQNMYDCAGNKSEKNMLLSFGIPSLPVPNDIVINELLFNPYPEGVDFVELYNRSDKILDLRDIRLLNRKKSTNELSSLCMISNVSYLFFPGEYLVLTENPQKVLLFYTTEQPLSFVKINNMPAFNDDEGTVVITERGLIIIDEFAYNEKMHFSLLSDREGVSLERIHYNRPSADSSNWHSAASTVGYATPGYKNSQFTEIVQPQNSIELVPEVFSPNNDGIDDILHIYYTLNEAALIANVFIFDINGQITIQLANNTLIGSTGMLTWDGRNKHGKIAVTGMYIVYFEVFSSSGKTQSFKKVCVLSMR